MLQMVPVHSALMRSVSSVRGGAAMVVAASIVAASPSATFDEHIIEQWTGWSPTAIRSLRKMMVDHGWLDAHGRLAGMAAQLLIEQEPVNEAEQLFVQACRYIASFKGTYKPTEPRRQMFMHMARKHGAKYVYNVVVHQVKKFVNMTINGKSMAKYATLETILRPSNFEKYRSAYEDTLG
ncbi:MAG: hypothetical protein D6790_00825 [Caldilineae bacterium]|nr:MAG: hypothetical protein D6790_00825 [Caldilineae bacterium]